MNAVLLGVACFIAGVSAGVALQVTCIWFQEWRSQRAVRS